MTGAAVSRQRSFGNTSRLTRVSAFSQHIPSSSSLVRPVTRPTQRCQELCDGDSHIPRKKNTHTRRHKREECDHNELRVCSCCFELVSRVQGGRGAYTGHKEGGRETERGEGGWKGRGQCDVQETRKHDQITGKNQDRACNNTIGRRRVLKMSRAEGKEEKEKEKGGTQIIQSGRQTRKGSNGRVRAAALRACRSSTRTRESPP